MDNITFSRVEMMASNYSVFIRKWLRLPKPLNTTAVYGKTMLQLQIASIIESGKVRTIMMLGY